MYATPEDAGSLAGKPVGACMHPTRILPKFPLGTSAHCQNARPARGSARVFPRASHHGTSALAQQKRTEGRLRLAQRYNLNILVSHATSYNKTRPKPWQSPLLVAACLLLTAGPTMAQQAAAQPRINALIVDGFSNHDWRKTTDFIKATLTETGIFKVADTTTPSEPNDPGWEQWRPQFSDYDVVVLNWNNIRQTELQWPQHAKLALEEYVRGGGGLLAFHSANNAFPRWSEYNRMIGLGWRTKDQGTALQLDAEGRIRQIPAGEGENTSHGPRQDTVVIRLNDHPITRGTPKRWMTPDIEVYTYARGPAEQLTVLTYGLHIATNRYWPLEWVVSYGRGRVYSSSFGHIWGSDVGVPDRVLCAGFQTSLIRAAEWLATGAVSYPVPDDFPSEDAIILRRP